MYRLLLFYASVSFKTRLDSAHAPVAAQTDESVRLRLAQASKARRNCNHFLSALTDLRVPGPDSPPPPIFVAAIGTSPAAAYASGLLALY